MKLVFAFALPAMAVALSACQFETNDSSDRPIWAREETIEALGRAYVEFPPDRASFSVTYSATRPDATEASFLASQRLNLATDAIREIAGDSVRIRAELNVSPYYEQVTVRLPQNRQELRENEHPDALLGYVSRAHLSVEIADLSIVETVRGIAIAAGPTELERVQFYLDETAAVQRRAFAAAVEDATARAEIVANASDNALGRLLVLREGPQTCLGQTYGSPGANNGSDVLMVTGSRIGRHSHVGGRHNRRRTDVAGQPIGHYHANPHRTRGRFRSGGRLPTRNR